jgi:hypothetical protein
MGVCFSVFESPTSCWGDSGVGVAARPTERKRFYSG